MYLHSLFRNVPAAERVALVARSELRSFRRNETVLRMDEWTDKVYFVASGLLRVVVGGNGGSAAVTTDFVRPRDLFLSPTLDEARYQSMANLVAALPSSVYLIPAAALHDICARHPSVALELLELTVKRMTIIRSQLRRISSLTSETLVARVLYELTQLAPADTGGFDKRISQAVIASYAGLSREVVNKTMREMENRGLLWKDEHGIHVVADFASTDHGSFESLEPHSASDEREGDTPFIAPDELDLLRTAGERGPGAK
jgi:CRP/FNR family transcriptional regulator, cyclic AMP receptor protein